MHYSTGSFWRKVQYIYFYSCLGSDDCYRAVLDDEEALNAGRLEERFHVDVDHLVYSHLLVVHD